MKVIIAGSRTITDKEFVYNVIKNSPFKITEIVSGCARGVDALAIRYAEENKIWFKAFQPCWKRFGRSAAVIRNIDMGRYADAAIVIIDGTSNAALHMKNYMEFVKKPVLSIDYYKKRISLYI